MLLIAGAAATGKTTFAKYAAEKLELPLFCKDEVKEILWDFSPGEEDDIDRQKVNGALAYSVLYYFAEQMMRAKLPFILESNFRKFAENRLRELIDRHGYLTVTVRFETGIEILHERFVARDLTAARHPGLRARGVYDNLDAFRVGFEQDRSFGLGPMIKVNTDDFSAVDYSAILREIKSAIAEG